MNEVEMKGRRIGGVEEENNKALRWSRRFERPVFVFIESRVAGEDTPILVGA